MDATPYLHREVDWEAGDPEHGDVRNACRLTDEGAEYMRKHLGVKIAREEDGSWILEK